MSYDIYLVEPESGEVVEFDEAHREAGGTHALGGTREAWLNITYNYAPHFYRLLGKHGIRSIYGRPARETVESLRAAIDALEDDECEDYWQPTEGNARRALVSLARLAEMRPDAIWEGD